jgi:TldD protein
MDILQLAKQNLLVPSGLTENDLTRVMGQLLGGRIDSGDLYFQSVQSEAYVLEDGIIKEGSHSLDQGVGLRAISGEKVGFAYSDDIILPALEQATQEARCIAQAQQSGSIKAWTKSQAVRPLYVASNPLDSLSALDKVQLLREVDAYARRCDARVSQVVVSLSGSFENILIVNTHGHLAADIRPLVRLSVNVVVEEQGRRESGSAGGGGRVNYDYFTTQQRAVGYAQEAVRQALVNLQAVSAPAGLMPVVLGPGWPGVLLHEAVGHGLEGDFNRKKSSVFADRMGEQVASSLCTVVDDGTLVDRRGSLTIDDEGVPTQRTVLIENGILKNYLQDTHNAKLMKMAATGNGRRQSYAHLPFPRMTNTFMLPGKSEPQDIIASVKKGLYAVNFGGGSVDITSGKFVFSASEAYLIENGKVTVPVKGATLIGNGPAVMEQITQVGNDLQLDSGIGSCGKEGQTVPVGVGQPTLLVKELTVGGTQQ